MTDADDFPTGNTPADIAAAAGSDSAVQTKPAKRGSVDPEDYNWDAVEDPEVVDDLGGDDEPKKPRSARARRRPTTPTRSPWRRWSCSTSRRKRPKRSARPACA
jgi:hypothetical protein